MAFRFWGEKVGKLDRLLNGGGDWGHRGYRSHHEGLIALRYKKEGREPEFGRAHVSRRNL